MPINVTVGHLNMSSLSSAMKKTDAIKPKDFERNRILFGAPGTGKSFKLDDPTKGYGLKKIPANRKFRTTFHPDYDYAQFVGSYKPLERKNADPGCLSEAQLTILFNDFKNKAGTYSVHKFGAVYWKSARTLTGQEKKNVVGQPASTMDTELNKGIAVGEFLGSLSAGSSITYSFVPQVFAKAYIAAWREYLTAENKEDIKPVYLVIEEINRGNCAQIFGDLFQLLDRKNGWSEYPIDVDNDFASYVRDEINKLGKFAEYRQAIRDCMEDAAEAAALGEDEFCKITLPPNLNILATMNTSDQSLFPMDSAFKRRFDWEYVPIKYEKDERCGESWNADQYVIEVTGSVRYSWLAFLKAVNTDIKNTTLSEDKQMGEFFVKPKNNVIDLDMFRSKVLFYLWDTVYKEETGRDKIFHFPVAEESEDKVSFQTYFEGTKEEQIALIKKIFEHLDVKPIAPSVATAAAAVPEETAPISDTDAEIQTAALEGTEA